ncbi:MAG TPA: hypothetical protein VGE86_03850 [Thermoanaerobaculia bacterium]
MNRDLFDEIQVFEGVAERTGTTVDRATVRRSPSFCRSVSELTRKARRMGDGYFYLASLLWPEDTTKLDLTQTWVTMR